jgi:hypothetical protein
MSKVIVKISTTPILKKIITEIEKRLTITSRTIGYRKENTSDLSMLVTKLVIVGPIEYNKERIISIIKKIQENYPQIISCE